MDQTRPVGPMEDEFSTLPRGPLTPWSGWGRSTPSRPVVAAAAHPRRCGGCVARWGSPQATGCSTRAPAREVPPSWLPGSSACNLSWWTRCPVRAPQPAGCSTGRSRCPAASGCPSGTARFDAAWSIGVLCTVADKVAVLTELRRVVRPGGPLGLLVFVRTAAVLPEQPDGNAFPDRGELEAAVEAASLRVLAQTPLADFPDPPPAWQDDGRGGRPGDRPGPSWRRQARGGAGAAAHHRPPARRRSRARVAAGGRRRMTVTPQHRTTTSGTSRRGAR